MLRIQLSNAIKQCCYVGGSRMSIECAQVLSGQNPFVVATNSQVLAIVRSDGENDGPATLIPSDAFPTRAQIGKTTGDKRPTVTYNGNGHCELVHKATRREIVVPADPGRFPKVADIIPTIVDDTRTVCLTLDASQLHRLHDALTTEDSKGLTLLIRLGDPGECVVDTVGVLGANGIGVIMPMWSKDDKPAEYVGKFNAFAGEFKAAITEK